MKGILIVAALLSLLGSAHSQSPKISLGAYVSTADGLAPWSMTAMHNFANISGRMPAMFNFFVGWGISANTFPTTPLNNARSLNATVMVTWSPGSGGDDPNDAKYSLATIMNASKPYTPYIKAWAISAKAWGHPFYLRMAHEFNGNWVPYGLNNSAFHNTPAQYAQFWQYVRGIFNSEGVTNVIWVWCANACSSNSPCNSLPAAYPGDAYVDWLAFDAYNTGTWGWQSFAQVASSVYLELTVNVSSNKNKIPKPVMVAEVSCGLRTGYNKTQWMLDTFLSEIPTNMPRVFSVLWWNQSGQTVSYTVNDTPSDLAAWRQVVASPLYKHPAYLPAPTGTKRITVRDGM